MNDNKNQNAMGEQIKGALAEALQSGDFKNLNDLVAQTVTDTLNEVGKHIAQGSTEAQNSAASQGGMAAQSGAASQGGMAAQNSTAAQGSAAAQNSTAAQSSTAAQGNTDVPGSNTTTGRNGFNEGNSRQIQAQQNADLSVVKSGKPGRAPNILSLIKFKKVGGVSNVLYQIFGGIGLGSTILVTLMQLLSMAVGETTMTLAGWIVSLGFLAFFSGMIRLGIGQWKCLKRAERYVQLCDYRMYGDISNLARGTGKSERYVRKDLQKMLDKGMFPEGHLDQQKTCFMLNDVVYRQYLELEKNRRQQERENGSEQRENAPMPGTQSSPQLRGEQETELNTMVAEGMECIRRLRDLNDKISGEVISAKLYQMENLLKDIFDSVREHPEQMHRMHKLMDYYLPTTLKLVEAYEEFDRVSTPGREILEAKAEIENTLDTINQAFRELLNNLFQDAVFDATTDAQVLKTMLAREGLTRELEPVIRQ